jgi:2-polyprenyl-3-methyl-5-hydroxy-6-metoxy-1,4-benzoquinol methylase
MQYERLEQCPVCNKEAFKNFMVVTDNAISKESFVLVQCENCLFKFTNPRPDEASIGRYYESEEYISHSNTSQGITNKAYQVVRAITLKQKVSLINRFVPQKGSILDYGCGTGHFLSACQKKGWKIAGFEPNAAARTQATALTGTTIEAADISIFAPASFEVITLWHVLEHIHQLNDTVKKILALLKPQGYLIVAVPNADSLDAQKYKESWAAYDVPRHLYHFNQNTMKRFLKKHKLDVEATLPMKFDAYYVSLLSEKYKNGSNNYLNSILTGYQSNTHAEKNTNDYSSLIYVATKK